MITRGQAGARSTRASSSTRSVLDGKPDTPHLVITPYPTRYVSPWKLTDGTEVLLRPIKSEDEPMIAEMLATMCEETLHDRFFEGVPDVRLTTGSCASPTSTTNARWPSSPSSPGRGSKRIIGVGRLIGDPERGDGEFTVIVHDEFHGTRPWLQARRRRHRHRRGARLQAARGNDQRRQPADAGPRRGAGLLGCVHGGRRHTGAAGSGIGVRCQPLAGPFVLSPAVQSVFTYDSAK